VGLATHTHVPTSSATATAHHFVVDGVREGNSLRICSSSSIQLCGILDFLASTMECSFSLYSSWFHVVLSMLVLFWW
jgi:hypothetical protein